MRLTACSLRPLTALLFAAAALLAAIPQLASAHDRHGHGSEVTTPRDVGQLFAYFERENALPLPVAHWSRSCPRGTGGTCCCSDVVANAGNGKPPLIHTVGRTVLSQPPVLRVKQTPVKTAPSRFPASLVLARAPPFFS